MASKRSAADGEYLTLAASVAILLPAPLSGLAQSAVAPIMPQIVDYFADEPHAGLLVRLMISGMGAAMILGSFATGYLAERFGQQRLLLVSLVIFAISGSAGFIIDNLYLLVASRIVLGVVNAIAGALAVAIVATRVVEHARERWIGFYTVGSTTGAVVTMLLVGAIAMIGWRYAFLPLLIALPIAAFIALTMPADRPAAPVGDGLEAKGGLPWSKMAFGLLIGASVSTIVMYLPFHLAEMGHGTPDKVALAIATSTGAAGLTSFSFGWVRRYLSVMQVFVTAFLAMGIGMSLIASAGSLGLVYVGMATYGAGLGVLNPNFYSSVAATVAPHLRARILGHVRASYYAGPLTAQIFLEVLMNRSGPAAAIAGNAAFAFVGAALILPCRRLFRPYGAERLA